MSKTIADYILERDLGVTSDQVLEAIKPVLEQIRQDTLKEFEALENFDYQKVDNHSLFGLHLRLKMVKEISDGLQRQMVAGKSAERTIKEHQER